MWPIIASILAGIVIIWLHLPTLRKTNYKEKAIFGLLIVLSMTIYTLQKLHIHVPNPLAFISAIYERMGLVIG